MTAVQSGNPADAHCITRIALQEVPKIILATGKLTTTTFNPLNKLKCKMATKMNATTVVGGGMAMEEDVEPAAIWLMCLSCAADFATIAPVDVAPPAPKVPEPKLTKTGDRFSNNSTHHRLETTDECT